MSTLFLTNQNTQAVSTEKKTLSRITVSHLTTRKALFSLANCPQKHQMPQHTEHQLHNTIINNYKKKKKTKMPTLLLCGVPPLLQSAKKEEKTCNFYTFSVTNYFYFHNTYLLIPSRMLLPLFNFGSSPLGRWWRHGGRYLHHLQ